MSQTAGDILVETLIRWGVDTVFGLPGDGINGVIEAIRVRQDEIRFIQVRHEESAAFAACGYSKFTGKLGVCLATSGPGGIHLLNGLYDAKFDGASVLAITGMHFHDLLGTHSQQDVELDKLFQDVCVYNQRVMGPEHMENVAELACRMAVTKKGVSHITIPADFQIQKLSNKNRSERNVPHHVSSVRAPFTRLPERTELQRAADVLNSGKNIAILIGRGALGAGHEVECIADLLGAPIIKALLGKAAVPDDSEFTTGGIGLLGTEPSQTAIENCDTFLMIGTSFPYLEFYPKPAQARCVQIDADPARIGLRYNAEVGLVGDAGATLRALMPMLQKNDDRRFLEKAQSGMKKWRELMHQQETQMTSPMKPQVIAAELGKRLPENAIVACDSGTIALWWARHIPAKRGQMHTVSGTLASMACGLPYAIAAQLAFPERPVYAFIGDGGFSMLMAEVATCVKYKLPIKIVIVKNNSLGQIKWEQMIFNGNPEFGCDLHPIDFAMFAKSCGAEGVTIDDPEICSSQMDHALSMRGPVLVEAVVDPLEAPMPPKVTAEQTKKFFEAIARGQPDAAKILKNVVKERVRELI